MISGVEVLETKFWHPSYPDATLVRSLNFGGEFVERRLRTLEEDFSEPLLAQTPHDALRLFESALADESAVVREAAAEQLMQMAD